MRKDVLAAVHGIGHALWPNQTPLRANSAGIVMRSTGIWIVSYSAILESTPLPQNRGTIHIPIGYPSGYSDPLPWRNKRPALIFLIHI